MSEEKGCIENTADSKTSAAADYRDNFMPQVHVIGRSTMVIAFVVSFLSVLFFFFIRGYQLPVASYISTVVAIASIGIGMWLTEPLAYWPVLGSAGTYMSYLSGNVGGMRFPVALSVQSSSGTDINDPKGQVATIVGIAVSVFVNLVILLIIVLSGSWLLSILPQAVLASFSLVMPCLLGCMMMLRFSSSKDGFVKVAGSSLPYLITAIASKLIINNLLPFLAAYGTAIAVALCILVAYGIYRIKNTRAAG
ncbi:MAG: hypothetical protein LBU16_02085 [Treponema sp.]|jgi:hypothetical protein|nr:hypothetical protein [Treponema sp.]